MPVYLADAIMAARRLADDLEIRCPASHSDAPAERASNALIHALRDAAGEAERAFTQPVR